MKEQGKNLDERISSAINTGKVEFDFETWKQKNPEAVKALQVDSKSRSDKSAAKELNLWRFIMKSPVVKLVATAAVIVAVVIVSQLGVFSTPAFARVIEKVTNAQSVKFFWRQKIGQQPTFLTKVYIQGDKMRLDIVSFEGLQEGAKQLQEEMEKRNLSSLYSTIGDLTAKQAVDIDHFRKTYTKRELDEETVAAFTQSNLVEQFRSIKHEDTEKLREESQDGRKIDVYLVRRVELMGFQGELSGEEGERMTVWVDRLSSLPIKILLEVSTDVEGKSEDWFEFSEFSWNEPIDADILSLEIPEGYETTEPQNFEEQFN